MSPGTVKRRLDGDRSAIDDALRRVREGTYGICEECGGPSARERLEVPPLAVRRVKCQKHEEDLRAGG